MSSVVASHSFASFYLTPYPTCYQTKIDEATQEGCVTYSYVSSSSNQTSK